MALIVNLLCAVFVVVFVNLVDWSLWVSIPVGLLWAFTGALGYVVFRSDPSEP